jgi:hypothetical protein
MNSLGQIRQAFAVSGAYDEISDAVLLDKTGENLLPF